MKERGGAAAARRDGKESCCENWNWRTTEREKIDNIFSLKPAYLDMPYHQQISCVMAPYPFFLIIGYIL